MKGHGQLVCDGLGLIDEPTGRAPTNWRNREVFRTGDIPDEKSAAEA